MNYDTLVNWAFEPIYQHCDVDGVILYALAVGAATDPTNEQELRFVYERDLVPLPSYSTLLGYPGLYLSDPRIGVDVSRLLNGEHRLRLHRPLPDPPFSVVSRNYVDSVVDKGAGKGA